MNRLFKNPKNVITVVVLGLCIAFSGILAAYVTMGMLSFASTRTDNSYVKELNKDDPGNYISKTRAKSIAIQDAGLDAAKVTVSKITLDWDDFRPNYDIELWSNGVEYEYEIDAKNGSVIEKSKERHFDNSVEEETNEDSNAGAAASGNSGSGSSGNGGSYGGGGGNGSYGNGGYGSYDDDYDDRYDDDDDDDDYDDYDYDDYYDDDRYDEDHYDDYDSDDDD